MNIMQHFSWKFPHLFKAISLNGKGANVRPNLPSIGGFFKSSGYIKVKLCKRLTNIKKSSILASCSPMHTRLPLKRKKKQEKGLQGDKNDFSQFNLTDLLLRRIIQYNMCEQ